MPPSSDLQWTFENSKFTAPDHVSPSSMQQLLGCLFAHALDKGLGITSAASLELPEYPLLHGRIAHEVLQRVFPKGTALLQMMLPPRQSRFLKNMFPSLRRNCFCL